MAGSGIVDLDVSGVVSEEQMLALFGEGLRPDANAFIAERVAAGMSFENARTQARLGRRFAERLWEMRDQPVPREPFPLAAQDDAANRVGIRSLLKAVPAPTSERWPVDFCHRSMREFA